jgi:tRNA A-37 threonylcarbamoyl transferase component Bud32/tetratricopeptide (TPR) repeat protein
MSVADETPDAPSSSVPRDALVAERYRIGREIGRGGMATVYQALDLRHDRQVALKFIHAEVADRLATERFRREIALLASLQHPHILALYDSGEFEGALFYVMPYVSGESLRGRLEREKQLPVDDAIRIAREVADALVSAHQHDIIHRDIKPENILLSQGHALVCDFGIARALSRAGARRLTDAGFAIGTLAYMSPEQASGDPIDGRSDLYSLGCVLYEMLTGRVPHDAPTMMALLAKRHAEPVKSIRTLRPEVLVEIDTAILKTLAATPDKRFQSVEEFSTAIAPARGAPTNASAPFLRSTRARAIAATLGLSAIGALFFAFRPAPLDPQMYVVFPFVHRNGAAPGLLDGNNCQQLLYEAFGRWDGITLVDDMRAHDAQARMSGESMSLSEALRSARSLHAGRMAWGEVWVDHDHIIVRGIMYDVRTAQRLKQYAITVRSDLVDAEQRFDELADTLLVPVVTAGHVMLPGSAEGVRGTRSIAALTAYFGAHEALAAWNLDSAQTLFQSAIALDPSYAHANYWLAQVMAWRGADPVQWLPSARQATRLSGRLSRTDSALAGALLSVANGEFADACNRYHRLSLGKDSLNFAVWFGLGDCRARDTVVVTSAASPSGYKFRSGYASAIQAYVRALTLVPSTYRAFTGPGFERLQDLLYTELRLRRGAAESDSVQWMAYPGLSHDTLAFVPYRYPEIASGRAARPASASAAIARNRVLLHTLVTGWVHEFPRSATAYEALAHTLEEQGRINGVGNFDGSAMAAIDRARTFAVDSTQRRRLALTRTRLLILSGDFASARALADSLLNASIGEDPAEADELMPIAALTGRVQRMTALLKLAVPKAHFLAANGQLVQPPLLVAENSRMLLGYAAVGAPVDSIAVTLQRIERALESFVPSADRALMRDGVESDALEEAYPTAPSLSLQRVRGEGDYLLDIQRAADKGDAATVHALLDKATNSRKLDRPGDLSIDLVYQEAWLLLQVGDSAGAVRRLDTSLNALSTLGPYVIAIVPHAAFLVRAMALRSDLAARAGDQRVARSWGSAVTELWSGADPELQVVVDRMRRNMR